MDAGELRDSRGEYRRTLMHEVVYADVPTSVLVAATTRRQRGGTALPQTSIYAANYVGGLDFAVGATHWRDLSCPAKQTLATHLNAAVHLARDKHVPVPAAGAGAAPALRFDSVVVVETLPSAKLPRVCAGYRVWLFVTPTQGNARDPFEVALAAHEQQVAGMDEEEARRVRAPTLTVQQRRVRDLATRARERALAMPFAFGHTMSFAESRRVQAVIAAKRATIERKARAEAARLRPMLDLVRVPPYAGFARYITPEDYHSGAVMQFLAPRTGRDRVEDATAAFLSTNMGERWGEARGDYPPLRAALPMGAAVDADTDALEAAAMGLPPAPFLADTIFCKERAMVYKVLSGGEYAICERHTHLGNYVPGVPIPDFVAREAADDADADAMDLDEAPPLRARQTLGELLTHDGRAAYADVSVVTFPAPALAYAVNQKAAMAEIFTTFVPLPWAIGAPLPDDEERWHDTDAGPLLPALSTAEESERLELVLELARIEQRESTAQLGLFETSGGVARFLPMRIGENVVQNAELEAETLADLEARAAMQATPRHRARYVAHGNDDDDDGDDDDDHEHEARRVAVAAMRTETGSTERHREARADQVHAVRHSIGLLATMYRQCVYDEFNVDGHTQTPLESTHTVMGLVDFTLPMRRSGSENETSLQRIERFDRQLQRAVETSNAAAAVDGSPPLVMTPALRARVASGVDILPSWSVERNDFLQRREMTQFMHGAMREGMAHEREQFNWDAPDQDARYAALLQKQRNTGRGWHAKTMEQTYKLFLETDKASSSFLEARDYIVANVLPHAAASPQTMLRTSLATRPYGIFRQWLVDTFVAVEKASAQNVGYFERCYVSMTQMHRWRPRRQEPAINYTAVGGTGVGKSYFLTHVSALMPVGTVKNMTTATTAAFNVDEDFDNTAYVYEEYDSSLLFTHKGPQDTGATDKINFFKARTTSFCTLTTYFHANEDNGQRMAKTCKSSQHVVTIGATNQLLEHMDQNIARRLALDYIMQRVADTDGGKATDIDGDSGLTEASPVPQQTQRLHRELNSAFMFVETAIKAGTLPDVLDDGAKITLNAILNHANERRRIPIDKSTRKHWVLEAARALTILYACYMGLYSRLAHFVYARESELHIARWSPAMYDRLVAPFLFTSKDALIHATTMFDFFYCSRDEDRLLATIAEGVCKVSSAAKRRFRRLQTNERGVYETDYNYLVITASDQSKIFSLIADAHKHIALPRPEDIRAQIKPYTILYKESAGFEGVMHPGTGAFTGQVRRANPATTRQLKRAAIFLEPDPAAPTANRGASQLCVSAEFVEDRFGVRIDETSEEEIHALLCGDGPVHSARLFRGPAPLLTPDALRSALARSSGWQVAAAMGECTDARAPLVASIRAVLSNPLLERSPFEDAETLPVPTEAMRYMTFYTPDDANVRFDPALPPVRVPLHGASMMLQLTRAPDGVLMRRDNHDRPMPTAVVSVYGSAPDAEVVDGANMTRGFVSDTFDIDFSMAVMQNTRLAAHGIVPLEHMFVKACAEEAAARGVHEDALFATMPDLPAMLAGTSTQPLPFAFGPITYRLEQHLERQLRGRPAADGVEAVAAAAALILVPTVPFPTLNIYERIRDTVLRRFSQIDKSLSAYRSFEETAGIPSGFVNRLPPLRNAPPARRLAGNDDDDDDDDDDERRAPRRQRDEEDEEEGGRGHKRRRDAAARDEEGQAPKRARVNEIA